MTRCRCRVCALGRDAVIIPPSHHPTSHSPPNFGMPSLPRAFGVVQSHSHHLQRQNTGHLLVGYRADVAVQIFDSMVGTLRLEAVPLSDFRWVLHRRYSHNLPPLSRRQDFCQCRILNLDMLAIGFCSHRLEALRGYPSMTAGAPAFDNPLINPERGQRPHEIRGKLPTTMCKISSCLSRIYGRLSSRRFVHAACW